LYLFFLVLFEYLQTLRQFFRSHGFSIADFFESVLVDSTAHEFALRNFLDPRKLFFARNCVSLTLVDDGARVQQAGIFPLLPVTVGFFADLNGRPVGDNMRPLQQPTRIELARASTRCKAFGLRMVLVRIQEHEEILWHDLVAIVFVS
jgi:hypothetical protein